MDPVSQGVLGASWSLACVRKSRKTEIRKALWLGWLSGMAPDLDIFIRSSSDPLLFLEYHRHFTHSIVFIPIGALICTLILHPLFAGALWKGLSALKESSLSWSRAYLYCFLGFASHGLLDSCTSYGTQMLWPFSKYRVAWDIVAIMDPLYTFPLLLLLFATLRSKNLLWSRIAFVFSFAYMFLGIFQHSRAIDALKKVIADRGHTAVRVQAKPSIFNMIVYRGIYETQDHFYVDAVRVPYWGPTRIYEGGRVPKFKWSEHPEIPKGSTLARDIERFEWFSQNYLVWHPTRPNTLTDFRYSMLPQSHQHYLWGIEVDTSQPDKHTPFVNFREVSPELLKNFWSTLRGL
jgi:inner membrane protein